MPDAGWYRDPAGSAQQRWWDGQAWTQHLRPTPAPTPPAEPPAPVSTPVAPAVPAPPAAPATYVPAPPVAASTYAPSAAASAPAGSSWPSDSPAQARQAGGNSVSPQADGGAAARNGRPSPPERRLRVWHLIAVALVSLLIGFIIGNSGKSSSSKATAVTTTTSPPVTTSPPTTRATLTPGAPNGTYAVGQTAKATGWSVTVYAVRNPQPPGTGAKPAAAAADHYVAVDVEVTNTGTVPVTWAGGVRFHLLDAHDNQYDLAAATGISPPAPTGVIPPGRSLRGLAVFSIPNTTTGGLRFLTQGTGTAPGVTFNLL